MLHRPGPVVVGPGSREILIKIYENPFEPWEPPLKILQSASDCMSVLDPHFFIVLVSTHMMEIFFSLLQILK